jgi:hypothetical protein
MALKSSTREWFVPAYIHLSVLLSILQWLFSEKELEFSQSFMGQIFQRESFANEYSQSSLFWVCLVVGQDSYFAAEGTY